ncbi:putative glucose uptake protein GlcU [Lentilactobacillus kisonensis F0435]|uniref:Putative glucose uptake protein GlcU n=1 Tax=Lentilactobacillus kisonensis F0435 TaxID=797516 RepID=H1LE96_9LACO|nr:putative glucose uptake protein GlcU [Lentilactobacillus kisonensis F0435]
MEVEGLNTLLLLLPALGWGLLPPVVAKLGGKPSNEILGTALGTLIASVGVFIVLRPQITLQSFLLAAFAGAFWIVGQVGQYHGYQKIGVSQTMPISTGLQLVGTSLIGVFIFGEWSTVVEKAFGALGVLLLIIGIWLTSITDRKQQGKNKQRVNTIIMLILTSAGYWVYNSIPRGLSESGLAIFLPESIGMVLAAVIYILATKQGNVFKEKTSWTNIIGGLIFSFAAVTYILSVKANGVNTAFVVSQVSVVISTLLGMVWMHETKSHRELMYTIMGLVLIVAGAVITTIF